MDRKRLLLVSVAVMAGALAAYLALRPSEPPRTRVAKPASQSSRPAETMVDVLVAAHQLQVGSEISQGSLRWQSMPTGRLPEGALTRKNEPDALAELQGQFVNQPIRNGEPLTHAKVQKHNSGGVLASQIGPGMRAIAVPLDAKNVRAVGGFILPNDRVDVVVTWPAKPNERASATEPPSRLVLQNIRVLAMGQNLVQTQIMGQKVAPTDVATLEVAPDQASELLTAMRERNAEITLILRPAGDMSKKAAPPDNKQLFTIRYGHVSKE